MLVLSETILGTKDSPLSASLLSQWDFFFLFTKWNWSLAHVKGRRRLGAARLHLDSRLWLWGACVATSGGCGLASLGSLNTKLGWTTIFLKFWCQVSDIFYYKMNQFDPPIIYISGFQPNVYFWIILILIWCGLRLNMYCQYKISLLLYCISLNIYEVFNILMNLLLL